MKKVYLSLIMMIAFVGAFAQTINQVKAPKKDLFQFTEAQQKGIKADIKKNHQTKGEQARVYNYAVTIDNALGNPGKVGSFFIFPDTLIKLQYSDGLFAPNIHSAAVVLDPLSEWFEANGELNMNMHSEYTFDSVSILGYYRRNLGDAIVDTLVVEFIPGGLEIPNYYFEGMEDIYYSEKVAFNGLYHENGMSIHSEKVTVKIPLTKEVADDTNAYGLNYFVVDCPEELIVDSGKTAIVTFQFIPGYTYSIDDTLGSKNFFRMLTFEEQGENSYPTYTYGDYNSSQIVNTTSKYDATSSWYGLYLPEWAFPQTYYLENHIVDFYLTGTNVGMDEIANNGLSVSQNQPNPFNGTTTINYSLEKASDVSVTVYNVTGAQVMSLNQGVKAAGSHRIQLDASNLPSGVYYYTFSADNSSITKKMIVY